MLYRQLLNIGDNFLCPEEKPIFHHFSISTMTNSDILSTPLYGQYKLTVKLIVKGEFLNMTQVWDKEENLSPLTGIEPMASQRPGRRSFH